MNNLEIRIIVTGGTFTESSVRTLFSISGLHLRRFNFYNRVCILL